MPVCRRTAVCWRSVIWLAAILCGVSGTTVPLLCGYHGQQAPAVTFKVDINHVEISAVVVDRSGRFVDGLRSADFEVYEDGTLQRISTFGLVNLDTVGPPAEQSDDVVRGDVETNAGPFEGRLYVLLLDDLHVDVLHTEPTRKLARQFVKTQVGPRDLAAVVCTGGCSGGSQDLTPDHGLLIAAIDRFVGRRWDASTGGGSGLPGRPAGGSVEDESRVDARAAFKTIRSIADGLATVGGRRKALLLFSEGIDAPEPMDMKDVHGGTAESLTDAIAAAVRANVTIYALDPGGLKLAGGKADTTPSIEGDPFATGFEGLQAEMRSRLGTLRRLSVETGGFAAVNTNAVTSALMRVGDENSRYYLLGYECPAGHRDGKFHQITVKVRIPRVEVRARSAYLAPRSAVATQGQEQEAKHDPGASVRAALDNPLPVPNVRMRVGAAPFGGNGDRSPVRIVVELDGRDIHFRRVDGRFEAALGLTIVATDSEGVIANSLTRAFTLPLHAESYDRVVANGFRLVERLGLPRGRFRLRVVVQDIESQRVGSVHYDVDVPNFAASALAISGLLLTSTRAAGVPSAPSDEMRALQSAGLPGPPSTMRVFRRGEALALMAEVYEHDRPPVRDIDVVATVTDGAGSVVYRRDERWSPRQARGGTCRCVTSIPTARLAPGSYVLAVEARGPTPGLRAIRSLRFQVELP